jgi:hypothetical protein
VAAYRDQQDVGFSRVEPHAGQGIQRLSLSVERIKGFQVRVVDADGRIVRTFTYPTIEAARRAARAWTVAYGNCPTEDKSGV